MLSWNENSIYLIKRNPFNKLEDERSWQSKCFTYSDESALVKAAGQNYFENFPQMQNIQCPVKTVQNSDSVQMLNNSVSAELDQREQQS